MRNNQNGFAFLGIILVIVCAVIIGSIGWFVFDVARPNKPAVSSEVKTNGISQDQAGKSISQTPKPTDIFDVQHLSGASTVGWKTFTYPDRFYSFKYPADWQFRDFGTSKSTQIESKLTTSSQRITSPNGVHNREYISWESTDAPNGGFPGTQILVNDSYDPDHPKTYTTDCKRDFSDYFLVKQVTNQSLQMCLFHYSDKYYAYQFNAGAQSFSIRLYFGDKSSKAERLEALKIFLSIGESFKYQPHKL